MSNTMNMINPAPALQETDALRADIYALVATLLRQPPQPELLNWLQELQADLEDNSAMAQAWNMLALQAQHGSKPQLEDEYHNLFIGVGRGEIMPFACWYLTGSLMEKPLVVLREDLALLGFKRQPEVKEPEDHMAALCEVMSMLIQTERSYEVQYQFWSKHIQNWSDHFFMDLQNAEHAVFYTAVGMLGHAFMQQEDNWYLQLSPAAREGGQ